MRRECRERFPRHRLQRKPLVSNLGMHHGTSGSLSREGGENVPGIPGACLTLDFTYLARGPWRIRKISLSHAKIWYFRVQEHAVEQTIELSMIWDAMALVRRHRNSHTVCSFACSGHTKNSFRLSSPTQDQQWWVIWFSRHSLRMHQYIYLLIARDFISLWEWLKLNFPDISTQAI